MPRHVGPNDRFDIVKSNNKYKVIHTDEYGGNRIVKEYDTFDEAHKEYEDLYMNSQSNRMSNRKEQELKDKAEVVKLEENRIRKREENFEKQSAQDVHSQRLEERKRELERYREIEIRNRLTRHQQRRNERSP